MSQASSTVFTIEDISKLNKLFYNYSSVDIHELKKNAEFLHFWHFKRFQWDSINQDDTHTQLVHGFFSYFSDELRVLLIRHAQYKYHVFVK